MRRSLWSVSVVVASLVLTATPSHAAVSETTVQSWGTNGTVYSVTRIGNLLVIGGKFTQVVSPTGQTRAAGNLAAVKADTGAFVWAAYAGGEVYKVESDGTSVWVGGQFGLKKFTSTGAATAFRAPYGVGTVRGIAVGDGRVYYGGATGVAASTTTGTGVWRTSELSGLRTGGVRAVALAGTRLLVGGYFCSINGVSKPGMAALQLTGQVDRGWTAPGFSCGTGVEGKTPYDIAVSGSDAYVAGAGQFNMLLKIDATTGATKWQRGADGDWQTVTVQGGYVYGGGHFVNVCQGGKCNVPRIHVARYSTGGILQHDWDPALGPTWAPYYYGVWAMRGDSAGLYVGGAFQHVNGTPRRSVAIFR